MWSSRAVVLLRWQVAAVMLTAAVAKSLRPESLGESLSALGVPPSLVTGAGGLLVLAEYAAAAMLFAPRLVAAGACASLILSAGFLTVTQMRLRSGTPDDCACFGAFLSLPPRQMIWVDVALLAASMLVLLSRLRPRAAVEAKPAPLAAPTAPSERRWAYGFLTLCVAALLAGGHAVQTAEPRPGAGGATGTPLRFGQTAPYLEEVRGASEAGQWRLVYFTCPDCAQAQRQLADVVRRVAPHASRLRVTVVIGGRNSVRARREADRLARVMPAEWVAVLDTDYRLLDAYAGRPRRRPFAALLDRRGKLLYAADGYYSSGAGLGEELAALAAGRPIRASDSGLYTLHIGRRLTASTYMELRAAARSAWSDEGNPLLVSWVSMSCGQCASFIDFINYTCGYRSDLHVLLYAMTRSDVEGLRRRRLPPQVAVLMDEHHLAAQCAASGTPFALLVDDGYVRYVSSSIAGGIELAQHLRVAPTSRVGDLAGQPGGNPGHPSQHHQRRSVP